MNRLLDKSYDFEFDKNENLTWYPWVGKLYKEGTRRILFVGDSHYSVDEMGDFDLECYDYYMSTKQTTREILSRFLREKLGIFIGIWKALLQVVTVFGRK